MTMLWDAVRAELRKAATLPGSWAGIAVTVLGSVALTALNAGMTRAAIDAGQPESRAFTSAFENAFAAMPLGTVGAVIVGVVMMSSEYAANSPDAGGGRQIASTLTATPRRWTVLAAKAIVVVAVVLGSAALALPATLGVAAALIGAAGAETSTVAEQLARCLGATLYWSMSGLIAFAITVVLRGGIVPLIVLIVNNSLVSIPLLLSTITPLAFWLPDLAGRQLFGGDYLVEGGLDALPGALVMAAWTAALLVVAGVVFRRRDA